MRRIPDATSGQLDAIVRGARAGHGRIALSEDVAVLVVDGKVHISGA